MVCIRDLQVWREREEAKGEGEVPDRVNGAAMKLSGQRVRTIKSRPEVRSRLKTSGGGQGQKVK